jgi:hypothetical protein
LLCFVLLCVSERQLAWLSPFNTDRTPQAACVCTDTVANRTRVEPSSNLTVIVPTDGASLPHNRNGDFGTSPFQGQHSYLIILAYKFQNVQRDSESKN